MLNEREEAIEAREKAATPAPWWIEAGRLMGQCKEGHERCATFIVDELDDPEGEDEVFIAHAREDIPYLLAQLREMRQERDEIHTSYAEAREKLAAVRELPLRHDKLPHATGGGCRSRCLACQRDRILEGGD